MNGYKKNSLKLMKMKKKMARICEGVLFQPHESSSVIGKLRNLLPA